MRRKIHFNIVSRKYGKFVLIMSASYNFFPLIFSFSSNPLQFFLSDSFIYIHTLAYTLNFFSSHFRSQIWLIIKI